MLFEWLNCLNEDDLRRWLGLHKQCAAVMAHLYQVSGFIKNKNIKIKLKEPSLLSFPCESRPTEHRTTKAR